MPYKCKKVKDKWIVHKQSKSGNWSALTSSGDHGTLMECNKQVRALYANEGGVTNEKCIDIGGAVDEYTHDSVGYQLSDTQENIVRCNISSRGGDFFAALGIYNKLRESGKHVVTCAQGLCASAGALILLAGDEIEAASNSIIMFHMPELGGQALNSKQMEDAAEKLKVCNQALIKTVQDRTGWEEKETCDFLDEAAWLTAEDAKRMGLIDKILPFKRRKIEAPVSDKLPEEILNFVTTSNKEVDTMNLKDVCSKLSIEVTDATTDDEMVAAIVNTFASHEGQVAELNGQITELKAKVAAIPEQKQKVSLPTTIINMVVRSRELELSSLVTEGKITPVVANELKNIFVTPDAISAAADEKGEVVDSFEKTIDALRKNEQVVNFAGKTSSQFVPKPEDLTGHTDLLIKDAERRLAK